VNTPKKVIIGLSGGVDSAVVALLLLQQGWEVEGLFMKNWEEDDTEEYCSAAEDLQDAQAVADMLGIQLHSVNFASEYWMYSATARLNLRHFSIMPWTWELNILLPPTTPGLKVMSMALPISVCAGTRKKTRPIFSTCSINSSFPTPCSPYPS